MVVTYDIPCGCKLLAKRTLPLGRGNPITTAAILDLCATHESELKTDLVSKVTADNTTRLEKANVAFTKEVTEIEAEPVEP